MLSSYTKLGIYVFVALELMLDHQILLPILYLSAFNYVKICWHSGSANLM
ncbi:unnamed protein product [Enterobius vermicularis]|uniref:Uncharacterized protein n=1 Tax=Enterobius vermicularis TaxID=51028 RepID=A0A0N4VMX4_ENTVE|nr:unnamed protein product [Enterobius vermicularis]